ncbi:MAG: cytidine deaminase [Pseudomonadota bacterium]|nr:cytidine deaminase [Pseudomonadota bacterium]
MDLFNLAGLVMKNAYTPYSNFKVGVAILSTTGNLYKGCNVENAAYPQGLCAESGAISAMIAGGCFKIREILIRSDAKKLIVPCGGCRQKIREFSYKETIVHLADSTGIKKTLSFEKLLPFSFDNSYLENKGKRSS